MNKIIITLLIGAFIEIHCAVNNENKTESRIMGGDTVFFNDYPFVAALHIQSNERFLCGGTIIHKEWILTAAHCLKHRKAESYYVRVGSSRSDIGGQVVHVMSMLIHPGYNQITSEGDFAMLGVGRGMILTPSINLLELPEAYSKFPSPGAIARVLGWGESIGRPEEQHKKLRELELPVIDLQLCQHAYINFWRQVKESMSCLDGTFMRKGPCYGDSGGPIVYNNKLIGVISWIKHCSVQTYPLVFQRIDVVLPWIDIVIDRYS